jgi:hypothetical protein
MSGEGGAEFTTEGALTLSIDERSLSEARDTVEDELGDIRTTADVTAVKLDRDAVRSARDSLEGALDGVPVTVDAQTDAGGIAADGGLGGGAASEAMGELVSQSATNLDLDETRNELLRDIEDLLEQIALQTEGGGDGGGGLFRSPRGRGTVRDALTGTAAGIATVFGLQQGTPAPGPAPDDGPTTPDTPTGTPDGLPITLPDPFDEGTPGRSPTVADGALSRQIAANRIGPDVGAQATAAGFLATGGLGVGLAGARLGATTLGSLGSELFGGSGAGGAAGALGLGGLGLGPTIADLPTGDLGALITDVFTEERSRSAAVDAFIQNNPGIAETSLSTEAGQRSLAGGEVVATIDRGDGGVGTATSPGAALEEATLVDVFPRGDELFATVRLDGRTFTRPLSELPRPLRERALGRGDTTRDRGGGDGGSGGASPRARSGATRRDNDEDTAARVREDVSRAIEGRPTTGPRDRPGSSNTRL